MVSIQTTNQPTRQDWVASTLSEKIFPGMSSKRSLEDLEGNEEWQPKKRKSRFDNSDDTAAAVSAAALKAAQLTASLRAQAPTSAVSSSSSSAHLFPMYGSPPAPLPFVTFAPSTFLTCALH